MNKQQPGIEWRDIPGYEGAYQVNNLGGVRSLPRYGRTKGKTLKPINTVRGYTRVTLRNGITQRSVEIHRLVAMAFLGNRLDLQVNHKNGIKSDNRTENLEWVTALENVKHSCETGLWNQRGDNCKTAILNSSQVKEIRSQYQQGVTQVALAKQYGVSESTIRNAVFRKTWRYV